MTEPSRGLRYISRVLSARKVDTHTWYTSVRWPMFAHFLALSRMTLSFNTCSQNAHWAQIRALQHDVVGPETPIEGSHGLNYSLLQAKRKRAHRKIRFREIRLIKCSGWCIVPVPCTLTTCSRREEASLSDGVVCCMRPVRASWLRGG